jgi:hypothetical protein
MVMFIQRTRQQGAAQARVHQAERGAEPERAITVAASCRAAHRENPERKDANGG